MNTWLRSNRWYLGAVAVLLPAALITAASIDWFDYAQAETGVPVDATPFDTIDYAGTGWTLLESHSFDSQSQAGQNAGLVAGTELVTATIAVNPPPAGSGTGCEVTLFDAAGKRQWDPASTSDADFVTAADTEDYCQPDVLEAYKLQVFFVVPEGAAAGATLHLDVLELFPNYIRFAL